MPILPNIAVDLLAEIGDMGCMLKQLLLATALIATPALAQPLPVRPVPGTATEVVWNVQAEAERTIKYKRDSDDVWQVAGKRGDCEDIVLWKRQRLIALGFSPSDLQVLVIIQPKSKRAGGVYEGHVILRVASENLVMDNATKFPVNYDAYMKDYNFKLVCEAVDFSPKMRLQERCLKN